MTTMRSVEPLTGIDALVVALFPFMGGTEPQPGEHGIDANGLVHTWEPGIGWVPVLAHPGPHFEAEAG
jgi:hypothetical protein